jgi:hypothetical protein
VLGVAVVLEAGAAGVKVPNPASNAGSALQKVHMTISPMRQRLSVNCRALKVYEKRSFS